MLINRHYSGQDKSNKQRVIILRQTPKNNPRGTVPEDAANVLNRVFPEWKTLIIDIEDSYDDALGEWELSLKCSRYVADLIVDACKEAGIKAELASFPRFNKLNPFMIMVYIWF